MNDVHDGEGQEAGTGHTWLSYGIAGVAGEGAMKIERSRRAGEDRRGCFHDLIWLGAVTKEPTQRPAVTGSILKMQKARKP